MHKSTNNLQDEKKREREMKNISSHDFWDDDTVVV